MSKLAWLITGLLVGGALGFFAAALCQAAARGDAHLDPVSRRQAADEQRVWDAANRSNE